MLALPLVLAGGKPPAPPRSRGAFAPLPATGRLGIQLRSRYSDLQRRHVRFARASSLQVAFTPASLVASPSLRSNRLRAHFSPLGLRPRAQKRARPLSNRAGAFQKHRAKRRRRSGRARGLRSPRPAPRFSLRSVWSRRRVPAPRLSPVWWGLLRATAL